MPLPLAPIGVVALRYGTVALATYAISRKLQTGRRDQRAEDAHDELAEGLTLHKEPRQSNATARFKRSFRLGANGPGVEIDASLMGRIRLKRL